MRKLTILRDANMQNKIIAINYYSILSLQLSTQKISQQ